jgi:hypothetical protein|tara:strand:- start:335 stop:505 length:171 start_codon:yes stop_codon:yes gene_type:complete
MKETKDFLEACIKEQKELDQSMREAFRQRDERKAKERTAKEQTESERLQDDLEPIN